MADESGSKRKEYYRRYHERLKQDPVRYAAYKERCHQRYLRLRSDEEAYRKVQEARTKRLRERYRDEDGYRKHMREYARERYRRLHPGCKKTVNEDYVDPPYTKSSLIHDIDQTIYLVKSQIKCAFTTVDVIEILLSIRQLANNI